MQRTGASSASSGKGQAGIALIAQDNVMTALQIEALLQDAGVTCVLAGSVEAALLALESKEIAFAVIDVNLGQETSGDVVAALLERKLPFVFTTSYDDDISLTKQFPGVSVLAKPLRETVLYQSLAKIGVI